MTLLSGVTATVLLHSENYYTTMQLMMCIVQ